MASQKVRPTALRRFFKTSTYLMYAFALEKPPSLVGRNFCLAMASQKFRPTALRRFFKTSTYLMYAFALEKPPSLVGRNFCLAIP
jgi:demethoxyubiquinone hydroxylase (CLK1/Coq7/Cat5 family)